MMNSFHELQTIVSRNGIGGLRKPRKTKSKPEMRKIETTQEPADEEKQTCSWVVVVSILLSCDHCVFCDSHSEQMLPVRKLQIYFILFYFDRCVFL